MEDNWNLDTKNEVTPLYHRWGYDPETNSVSIDSRDKSEERGYAVRINGGWRIFDLDSKPVEDLYVIRQVLSALKNEVEEVQPSMDYDFDRLHYGQPIPANENKLSQE